MLFNSKEAIVIKNSDGTCKIKLIDCVFKNVNGEEVSAMVIFPRVSEKGAGSFENENTLPGSEIFQIVVPEVQTIRLCF